jgi:hypothetical protein
MRSDRYFHPEFGWFAPRSRLRRELRIGFFSMLVGLGTGVAAVTAVSTGPHERDSGSVASVQDGIAKPLPSTEPYKRVETPSRTAAVGHDNENRLGTIRIAIGKYARRGTWRASMRGARGPSRVTLISRLLVEYPSAAQMA